MRLLLDMRMIGTLKFCAGTAKNKGTITAIVRKLSKKLLLDITIPGRPEFTAGTAKNKGTITAIVAKV